MFRGKVFQLTLPGDSYRVLVFLPQGQQAAGAMYSTVNDLLKYLSANMGLNMVLDQYGLWELILENRLYGIMPA